MTPYNEDARLHITRGRQQRFNELDQPDAHAGEAMRARETGTAEKGAPATR